MPKTITLSDLSIQQIIIDVLSSTVTVNYNLLDSDGNTVGSSQMRFSPNAPGPTPNTTFTTLNPPPDWRQLQSTQLLLLSQLASGLRNAMLDLVR